MSDVTLFKPNQLIGAIDKFDVPRTAKHLLNYFLQHAQHEINKGYEGNEFTVNILAVNDMAEVRFKNYALLTNALKKLMQPIVMTDKPPVFVAFVPVTYIEVDMENCLYRYRLDDIVIKLLKGNNYFTQLNLSEFNLLQSKHSISIYEWLKRHENIDTQPKMPPLPVKRFREITHTEEGPAGENRTYNNFAQIQKKILDVAVGEINEYTPYQVSYKTITEKTRHRPKVSEIQFYFAPKNAAEKAGKADSEVFRLPVFKRLQKVCDGDYMTPQFFILATYRCPVRTLEQYAKDLEDTGMRPKKSKFFEWLDDRCKRNPQYVSHPHFFSKDFFESVFCTVKQEYNSMGLPEPPVRTVNKEFVKQAMDMYGKYPYEKYRLYLASLWRDFEKQFGVNRDNVFDSSSDPDSLTIVNDPDLLEWAKNREKKFFIPAGARLVRSDD